LKNASIGDYTYGVPEIKWWGEENAKLRIGKYCSIAGGVKIFLGGDHRVDWVSTYPFNSLLDDFRHITGHPFSKGDVVIGNDVWIGTDAKIMSGVRIGDGAVIAAGAVVTKDIPPYCIAGGVSARVIKQRFPDAIIEKLEKIQWWNWPEEHIIEVIPLLQSGNVERLFDYYDRTIVENAVSTRGLCCHG
jgi:acetyltransferase-like isoleucine patch superfamily enzyme